MEHLRKTQVNGWWLLQLNAAKSCFLFLSSLWTVVRSTAESLTQDFTTATKCWWVKCLQQLTARGAHQNKASLNTSFLTINADVTLITLYLLKGFGAVFSFQTLPTTRTTLIKSTDRTNLSQHGEYGVVPRCQCLLGLIPPYGNAAEGANKGWSRVSVTWLGFCVQCAAVWKRSQMLEQQQRLYFKTSFLHPQITVHVDFLDGVLCLVHTSGEFSNVDWFNKNHRRPQTRPQV